MANGDALDKIQKMIANIKIAILSLVFATERVALNKKSLWSTATVEPGRCFDLIPAMSAIRNCTNIKKAKLPIAVIVYVYVLIMSINLYT